MNTNTKCMYCGKNHAAKCPLVKSIEYFENGTVKRVEFYSPNDYYTPIKLYSNPNTSDFHSVPLPYALSFEKCISEVICSKDSYFGAVAV